MEVTGGPEFIGVEVAVVLLEGWDKVLADEQLDGALSIFDLSPESFDYFGY